MSVTAIADCGGRWLRAGLLLVALLAQGASAAAAEAAAEADGVVAATEADADAAGSTTGANVPPERTRAGPPPTGTPVADTFYGTLVRDPYRHLEHTADESVTAWMRAQSAETRAALDALPGRADLLQRMELVERAAPERIFSVERLPGERYRYLKRMPNDNGVRLYRRDGARGMERMLVDLFPWIEATGHSFAFSFFASSPHGRYLSYGLSEGGSEAATMRVLRTDTLEDMIGPIDRVDLDSGESGDTGIGWLPDETGFFFNQLAPGADERPRAERYHWTRAFLRRFGDPDSERIPVFGGPSMAGVALQPSDVPAVFVPTVETIALALVVHGTQREFSVYTAPLAEVKKHRARWTLLFGPEAKVTGFSLRRDQMYLVTHRDAPRFKITRTSLTKPDIAGAELVYEPPRGIIQTIASAHDALYIKVRDGMQLMLLRLEHRRGATPVPVPLPGPGTFEIINPDGRIAGVLVRAEGWDHAYQYLRYDPRRGKWINEALQPLGAYDRPSDLEVTETEAVSHDGVKVPLSIVHRKGLRRDGNNPVLLQGYGSYGSTDEPAFDPTQLAWLSRGGVNAVCHVRGGGVHGRAWYEAGKGATKPNTWKDGIACAEYLIANGYTKPSKLAVFGGSAGGIFAGRVITSRPDLFAAAVIQVGALDMVRSETTATGSQNTPEFGTVRDEHGFRALLEMSAYHHVADATRYPAVLFIHGVNDSRVDVWHSLKMAARLSAAHPANVAMLRLDYDAGHGSGSSRAQRQEELADMWSFILWRTGDPAFQPVPASSPAP
jgi:prolyl oligopeptidase